MTLDFTPPMEPGSSPLLMLKFESLSMIGLPSHLTVLLPLSVCADIAMFGYGVGTGPPGVGVLQTSSWVVAIPVLALCTTVSGGLTVTLTGIGNSLETQFEKAAWAWASSAGSFMATPYFALQTNITRWRSSSRMSVSSSPG